MRIGIDVDGVLTDIERYMWDYGAKYLMELGEEICIDHTQYYSSDVFGWDANRDKLYWDEIFEDYSKQVDIRRFASDMIRKLKKDGHEIYIITARGRVGEVTEKEKKKSNKMLEKWLKVNKVKYDKLIFTNEDKLSTCLENEIEVMIEDSPNNIKQLSKKIPILCMHSSYNTKVRGKNIVRCHTWHEIYDKINRSTYKGGVENEKTNN